MCLAAATAQLRLVLTLPVSRTPVPHHVALTKDNERSAGVSHKMEIHSLVCRKESADAVCPTRHVLSSLCRSRYCRQERHRSLAHPRRPVSTPLTFQQIPAGFTQVQRALPATGIPPAEILVVMEITSTYWMALATLLVGKGFAVSVINPHQAHHFAKALLKRAKTDAIDAQTLAQLAALLQPACWPPSSTLYHELYQRLTQRGLAAAGCGLGALGPPAPNRHRHWPADRGLDPGHHAQLHALYHAGGDRRLR